MIQHYNWPYGNVGWQNKFINKPIDHDGMHIAHCKSPSPNSFLQAPHLQLSNTSNNMGIFWPEFVEEAFALHKGWALLWGWWISGFWTIATPRILSWNFSPTNSIFFDLTNHTPFILLTWSDLNKDSDYIRLVIGVVIITPKLTDSEVWVLLHVGNTDT